MALQSPFASADVQISKAQPEVVEHVRNRKRARCLSADVDNIPLSKIPQHSNRQQNATVAALLDHNPVTLHRPTPHRPTASTPCCFGGLSATHALQLRTSSIVATRPAAPTVVPSSLATAAALATVNASSRSSGSHPSDDDSASPTQPVRSQECPGKQHSAISANDMQFVIKATQCSVAGKFASLPSALPLAVLCLSCRC